MVSYTEWVSILMRRYSDTNDATEIMSVAGRTWSANRDLLKDASQSEAEEISKQV